MPRSRRRRAREAVADLMEIFRNNSCRGRLTARFVIRTFALRLQRQDALRRVRDTRHLETPPRLPTCCGEREAWNGIAGRRLSGCRVARAVSPTEDLPP
jgi:hypothetical protein